MGSSTHLGDDIICTHLGRCHHPGLTCGDVFTSTHLCDVFTSTHLVMIISLYINLCDGFTSNSHLWDEDNHVLTLCDVFTQYCTCEHGLEVPFKLMHPNQMQRGKEELVFEEFKRSNMKGMKADNDEDDGNVVRGDDMAPKEK
ncbi:unnamed protein product [Arctogadus glacialis]